MNEIEAYIRQAALARGIDPDVAVQVAISEGGLIDPFRQSDVINDAGRRETSYGPFQLLMGGGLGDEALSAGIDPRKNWRGGVDFALTEARKGGWDPWYGAAKAGIEDMEGIGVGPGAGLSAPAYTPGSDVGAGLSAPAYPGKTLTSVPVSPAPAPGSPATPSGLDWSKLLGEDSPLSNIGNALGGGGGGDPSLNQITPSSIGAETGSSAIAGGAAQLMMQLMSERRKRWGRSLSGV